MSSVLLYAERDRSSQKASWPVNTVDVLEDRNSRKVFNVAYSEHHLHVQRCASETDDARQRGAEAHQTRIAAAFAYQPKRTQAVNQEPG